MSNTTEEDSPSLRSMSIRDFVVVQLEEQERIISSHHEAQHHRGPMPPSKPIPMSSTSASSPTSVAYHQQQHAKSFSTSPASAPTAASNTEEQDRKPAVLLASVADIVPRPLPALTILSHSTLFIDSHYQEQENLDCSQVLRRIEGLIHAKSLSYTVNLDAASIECRVGSCLCFAINIWCSDNPSNGNEANNSQTDNNDCNSIIVELQRRSGCAIIMQRIRKALFHAILQTGHQDPSNESIEHCPASRFKHVSPRVKQMMTRNLHSHHHNSQSATKTMKRKSDENGNGEQLIKLGRNENEDEELQECMGACQELLCSERHDLNELGLESLVQMTDPESSSSDSAVESVAQAVLGEDEEHGSLHESLACLLKRNVPKKASSRPRGSFKYEYAQGMPPVEKEQEEDRRNMVILSLTVLSNALKVVSRTQRAEVNGSSNSNQDIIESLQQQQQQQQQHSWRCIACALKNCLRDPARHFEEAALAAKIIRQLEESSSASILSNKSNESSSSSSWLLLSDVELVERLVDARRVGEAHYRLLQTESDILLQHLSTVQ